MRKGKNRTDMTLTWRQAARAAISIAYLVLDAGQRLAESKRILLRPRRGRSTVRPGVPHRAVALAQMEGGRDRRTLRDGVGSSVLQGYVGVVHGPNEL